MTINKLKKILNYLISIVSRRVTLSEHNYTLAFLKLNRVAVQAANLEYEPEILALYQRSLSSKGGYFIDVGANYGQTLFSVLRVDRNIPYVGIEPQPDCVSALTSFIRENKLPNHNVICACVSDKESISQLQYDHQGDVRASIIEDFRPAQTFSSSMFTVAVSGDSLVDQLVSTTVQFIKIDVEGAELEVLNSFRRSILRDTPVISFEILPDKLVSTGESLKGHVLNTRREREAGIRDLLESLNYEYFLLKGDDELRVALGPSPTGRVRNYVARPRDQNNSDGRDGALL
jgi:FkbM family methyltransferase